MKRSLKKNNKIISHKSYQNITFNKSKKSKLNSSDNFIKSFAINEVKK